jgi:hypothetical protein
MGASNVIGFLPLGVTITRTVLMPGSASAIPLTIQVPSGYLVATRSGLWLPGVGGSRARRTSFAGKRELGIGGDIIMPRDIGRVQDPQCPYRLEADGHSRIGCQRWCGGVAQIAVVARVGRRERPWTGVCSAGVDVSL